MALLQLDSIYYKTTDNYILKDINLSIDEGDFISIVGPSGGGKSTLLKLCGDLISPTKGEIIYQGKNILEYNPMEYRRQVSYCFQNPYLFGEKIIDNLIFPFQMKKQEVDYDSIKKYLDLFNLKQEILDKKHTKLSGGEKQRISIIRTLLCNPKILLLDEITSALDAENTKIVEDMMKDLNNEGTTILWVTHNLEQSRKYSNKLLTIEYGEQKSLEVLKNE